MKHNELQVLLTFLSLVTAVVLLNSAFYNATTAYKFNMQAIIKGSNS